ncbi:hypothetical protein ABT187_44305 [Streptomyces sp. NPDC001817]|uniref:hypothetical protein n=1 Tax=Streptomyces sp. NPDC001817 TaxID=3154398 RepID=UPI00331E9D92
MTTGYAAVAATPLGGTPSVESTAEAVSDEQDSAELVFYPLPVSYGGDGWFQTSSNLPMI